MALSMFASFRGYVLASLLLTTAVVSHAVYTKRFFYRAVVFLASSKFAILAVGNMALVSVLLLWRLVQAIFLGPLRFREVERLHIRSRDAIIESCFAISVFRDDFNLKFVALVMTLLLLKSMHWLTKDRIEFLEEQPLSPLRTHLRLIGLMSLLLLVDLVMTRRFALYTYRSRDPTMFVLFAFEFTVLVIELVSDIVRYAFLVIDTSMEGHWEEKGMFSFYIELLSDLCQLTVYVLFFMYVQLFYSFPYHIIRELYMTFHKFQRRCTDFLRYRRVVATMNDLFADATEEELADGDRTCIICREEMQAAKKLACGHIFHARCLQSWLKRQLSCPTCRANIDVNGNTTQTSQNGGADNRAPNQPHGNANNNMNNAANNDAENQNIAGPQPNNQRPANIGEAGARLMNIANQWWNQVMNEAGGDGAAREQGNAGRQGGGPPQRHNAREPHGPPMGMGGNMYLRGPNAVAHMQLRARRRGAWPQPFQPYQMPQNAGPIPAMHPRNHQQPHHMHHHPHAHPYAGHIPQYPHANLNQVPVHPNENGRTDAEHARVHPAPAPPAHIGSGGAAHPRNAVTRTETPAQAPSESSVRSDGDQVPNTSLRSSSQQNGEVGGGTDTGDATGSLPEQSQTQNDQRTTSDATRMEPRPSVTRIEPSFMQRNSATSRSAGNAPPSEDAVLRSISLERLLAIQEQVEVLRGEIMDLVLAATTAPSATADESSVVAVPSESSLDVCLQGVPEEDAVLPVESPPPEAENREEGRFAVAGRGEVDGEEANSEAATLRRRRIEFLERNSGS